MHDGRGITQIGFLGSVERLGSYFQQPYRRVGSSRNVDWWLNGWPAHAALLFRVQSWMQSKSWFEGFDCLLCGDVKVSGVDRVAQGGVRSSLPSLPQCRCHCSMYGRTCFETIHVYEQHLIFCSSRGLFLPKPN